MRAESLDLAELVYTASVYRKRKFYSEAIDLLIEALNASKGQSSSASEAIVQYSLAQVYEEQGNSFFAKELYEQALNDWHGKKVFNPLHHLWPYGTFRTIESACQRLIRQVEQRNNIQNLPLPAVPQGERWLKAS
jgi:tetratricopeptide (TPR) repeat protein